MSNKLKIYGDIEAGSIFFVGSTVDPKPLGVVVASAHPTLADRIIVERNDRFQKDKVSFRVLFGQLNINRVCNKAGEELTTQLGYDRQQVVDYINGQSNLQGGTSGGDGSGIDMVGETVCFKLDDTSTSVMIDTGHEFGVNTIKAVANGGDIDIVSQLGDLVHFTGLQVGNVCGNDGTIVAGGLNDVINYLNELFTVGAFEAIVITDPEATTIADVGGVDTTYTLVGSTAIDPIGEGIFTNSGSGNYAGLKSVDTIDQVGEYFTFDIKGESQIGFGLIHTDASYAAGLYSGSAAYANPSSFAVSNSAHYGFQFSHWFHPTPNGSWTNYGANTAYSMREHWSTNWDKKQDWLDGEAVKVRVGLDANGFISIETLNDDGTWGVHARTTYPQIEGAEFHLGIKVQNASGSVVSVPKVHLLPEVAPTMYFRYIESPDGVFHYPVFATADEADYYDENHDGTTGTGTHSTIVFPDDPTFSTWYIPTTGYENNGSAAPTTGTFEGNAINWNEITSLVNADLAPQAFDLPDMNVNELSSVNIQVAPQDSSFTTTVTGLPSGLNLVSHHIEGTAPEVTGDNVSNPSDSYTVTVTRSNSYGSSTDTFDIIVANLTAPITAISGFNHVSGTTAMIDSDTMDDGSVVHVNNTVADGERFVIEKAYVETNILPALQGTGDMYIIGLHNTASDFSTLEVSDFDAAIVWEYESASSHTFKFYRDGGLQQNIVIGSLTQAFYDYAIEADGTSAWLIACNINSIMNEPSPSEGGTFSYTYEVTNTEDTAPLQIHMATLNTSGDISTDDIETIDTPAPPVGNSTSFSKALDFSGGAEYASQVSNSIYSNPLNMGGVNTQVSAPSTSGHTSSSTSARPWATAVIFKYDGDNSNQHIWNAGEGAGSTDDNIYLRLDASGHLYFGWGRDGALNECKFIYLGTGANVNHWHGIYIAHNGTRLGGTSATAANLAAAFDIRWFTTNSTGGTWGTWLDNKSTAANWSNGTVGGRMDRQFTGTMTIGGRGANRNFHGKVASMVVTSLRVGQPMPDNTEIESMMNDPKQWLQDYRVGQSVRNADSYTDSSWGGSSVVSSGYGNTQIWLMGDGTADSYSNGIRNEVAPNDTNYTKLQLNSMVSNDIETVNINGLT